MNNRYSIYKLHPKTGDKELMIANVGDDLAVLLIEMLNRDMCSVYVMEACHEQNYERCENAD